MAPPPRLHSTGTSASPPHLPPELIRHILHVGASSITTYADRNRFLLAAALVSREWRHAAQYELWERVELRTYSESSSFFEAQLHTPRRTHELSLGPNPLGSTSEPVHSFDSEQTGGEMRVLGACEGVRVLRLSEDIEFRLGSFCHPSLAGLKTLELGCDLILYSSKSPIPALSSPAFELSTLILIEPLQHTISTILSEILPQPSLTSLKLDMQAGHYGRYLSTYWNKLAAQLKPLTPQLRTLELIGMTSLSLLSCMHPFLSALTSLQHSRCDSGDAWTLQYISSKLDSWVIADSS